MPSIVCPRCTRPLKYDEAAAGRKGQCKCGQILQLPPSPTGTERAPAAQAPAAAGPQCIGCGGSDGLQPSAYWAARGRTHVGGVAFFRDAHNGSDLVCDACARAEGRKFALRKTLAASWMVLTMGPSLVLLLLVASGTMNSPSPGANGVWVIANGPFAGMEVGAPIALAVVFLAVAGLIGLIWYIIALRFGGRFRHGGMVALRRRVGDLARDGYRYFGEGTATESPLHKDLYILKDDGRSWIPFYDQRLRLVRR